MRRTVNAVYVGSNPTPRALTVPCEPLKLMVCWGTFSHPGGHPCEKAHTTLKEAGYDPAVVRGYGSMLPPDAIFNRAAGRREAKERTGSVPCPCS